ncbi:MAG: hypothetical protein QM759_17035 [Terricaulis sp.]
MKKPNDTQKGAFFSLLGAALIVVLAVMAMKAADQNPQPHFGHAHAYETAEAQRHSAEPG